MAISLDADLQDDVDVIDKMVEKYYEGNDVVYGVRSARDMTPSLRNLLPRAFIRSCRLWAWKSYLTMQITVL